MEGAIVNTQSGPLMEHMYVLMYSICSTLQMDKGCSTVNSQWPDHMTLTGDWAVDVENCHLTRASVFDFNGKEQVA